MIRKSVLVIFSGFSASVCLLGQASPCIPTAEQAAQTFRGRAGATRQGRGPATEPAPRNLAVIAIPGVVAEGVKWTKVWQAAGNSADGIIPDKDGSVLVAQEDYDTVLKIDPNGHASVAITDVKGIGSLSMDRQGRLYGAHRTERPGSTKPDRESIVNAISLLTPDRKTIADKWVDGTALTVRPNDLLADGHGGAYFTTGCLYYAGPQGVAVLADHLRTNGIAFSPDDRTLYVTNGGALVAFDVQAPGVLANQRDFAMLQAGGNGDGMAVDSEGRLYVTSNPGVQVFDRTGRFLGVIPTPRGVISVAFAGPGKQTVYVVGSGADDENGHPIRQGPQQTAATIYSLPMIAHGLKDRAK